MVVYTELEVIDFVTKETKDFTTLKEFSDYLKEWEFNKYNCWMPEFCKDKIKAIVSLKTTIILNKYNLLFNRRNISIFNGLESIIINTDYGVEIDPDIVENIISDIGLDMGYTMIKHDFDKYYEHIFKVVKEDD